MVTLSYGWLVLIVGLAFWAGIIFHAKVGPKIDARFDTDGD